MKKVNFFYITLLVGAFISNYNEIVAQDFLAGYVVLNTGDTISGELKNLSHSNRCKKVNIIDKTGQKHKIKPDNARTYVIGKDFYVVKTIQEITNYYGEKRFIRIVEMGKVNLYEFCRKSTTTTAGGGSVNSFITNYFVEKDETFNLVYANRKFKEQMSEYFIDFPEISKKIKNEELKYNDIPLIIQLYNEVD